MGRGITKLEQSGLDVKADGTAAMAYVGAEKPWHDLGVQVDDPMTSNQAIPLGGLDFPVEKQQAYHLGKEVKDTFHVVRTDTNDVLGTVGKRYQIFQQKDAFAFADDIMQDPNGPHYHTVGVLYGGRRIWALAKLPEFIEVTKKDIVETYFLFWNSHDGTGGGGRFTPIRVVCQNTLQAALRGSKDEYKIRHTGDLMSSTRVMKAQDILGIARQELVSTADLYKDLAKHEVSKEEMEDVLNRLFPKTQTKRSENQKERVLNLYNGEGMGSNLDGSRGTAWGLYNAYTELEDHHNLGGSKSEDADSQRLKSIWFGDAQRRKTDALETITEVCLR